jgi:MFS transporter, PHS family, inorganic phosphate transporter
MGSSPPAPIEQHELDQLDSSKVTGFQIKIMFISGMGFFTDAYDLFIIGIVVAILKTEWGLTTAETSLLNSATLLASAFGAIIFGRVADMLGRKRIYGYEVLILAFGAIASGLAPNLWVLLVARIILGIGIGGDYPVSATIMSEYSGKKDRGRMVGLVFAMQGAGLVVGPLVASILLATGLSHDIIWRILLILGAVPGLAVFYLRRQIHETPRFAAAGGDHDEARAAIAAATGESSAPPSGESSARPKGSALDGYVRLLTNPRTLKWIIGTALAWFVFDIAYYGNSISSPEVLKALNPHASLIENTLLQLLIFAVFALPGYALAIIFMDKIGRKTIQVMGFILMAAAFLAIGLIGAVTATTALFVIVFGISYLFSEFGPNTTTFIYPAEIFPTTVRTTAHGMSAASGKVGAFVGAAIFPFLLASSSGLRGAEIVCGAVSIVGLIVTLICLPEPRGKTLEELEAMALGNDKVPSSPSSPAPRMRPGEA